MHKVLPARVPGRTRHLQNSAHSIIIKHNLSVRADNADQESVIEVEV